MRLNCRSLFTFTLMAVALILEPVSAAPASLVPVDSAMGRATGMQQVLVSPLDSADGIEKRGWQLGELSAGIAPAAIGTKLGNSALQFAGTSLQAGAKGDFVIPCQKLTGVGEVGAWIYLSPQSNLESVGFQFVDDEDETLLTKIPADWTGWKWVEVAIDASAVVQAYPQPDKNGHVDGAVKALSIIWYAKDAGPTSLVVDALVATVKADLKATGISAILSSSITPEPDAPLAAQLMLTNYDSNRADVDVEFVIQENPLLSEMQPPDPVYGSDHAIGAKSRTEYQGKMIEEGSLTDNDPHTSASTLWNAAGYGDVFQYVDLDRARTITHLAILNGDANWEWYVDIDSSMDGSKYTPVEGLQNLDWHQKWGHLEIAVPTPFKARHLRLRYHKPGDKPSAVRMPNTLSIYDGVQDENMAIPQIGTVIAKGHQRLTVNAHAFAAVPLEAAAPLGSGSYLLDARIVCGGKTQLTQRQILVMPSPPPPAPSADSRFGMNSASTKPADLLRRLGMGWVRFENLKWPMMSPGPDKFAFDGSVAPWHVDADQMFSDWRQHGLHVLPYLFQTPAYQQLPGVPNEATGFNSPPRDKEAFAEFVFQTVARYGSVKHPDSELKSNDKKSGMKLIDTYELWNEADLDNKDWGSFRAPIGAYFEMLRAGYEAAKRADPSVKITNSGWADMRLASVDRMRTYSYADGKHPLDFIDILNVHHYTGKSAPEIATEDSNTDRDGDEGRNGTFQDDLRKLVAWRDEYKPAAPIWMTETGYDTGGPYVVSERVQAAYLPRDVMLILANKIAKVFIYRDTGSTDSLFAASGVLRDDGSLKPSYFTVATMTRQLDGATEAKRLPSDNNVWLYAWRCGDHTIVTGWTVAGDGSAKLQLGDCTITDSFGKAHHAAVNGDQPLSIFPTYFSDLKAPAIKQVWDSAHQREVDEQKALVRQANLKAYIFDFGATGSPRTITIGKPRPAIPVLNGTLWSKASGYGFMPKAAAGDQVYGWLPEGMDRDSVRVPADVQFRFNADAGQYHLGLKATPLGDTVNITITGLVGGSKTFAVTHDKSIDVDVEVGTEPISITVSDYADIAALKLIEKL